MPSSRAWLVLGVWAGRSTFSIRLTLDAQDADHLAATVAADDDLRARVINGTEEGFTCFGDGGKRGVVHDIFSCTGDESKLQCENPELSRQERRVRRKSGGTHCWGRFLFWFKSCRCGNGKRWCVNPLTKMENGTCSSCYPPGTQSVTEDGECECKAGFAWPTCHCSRDSDCDDGLACASNGQCMSPCEKHNRENPGKLPKTRCYASKRDLLEDAGAWCRSSGKSQSIIDDLADKHMQLPDKMKGLYWMRKGSGFSHFCVSTAKYSHWKSGGRVTVYDPDLIFEDTQRGWALGSKSASAKKWLFRGKRVFFEFEFQNEDKTVAKMRTRFRSALRRFGQNLKGIGKRTYMEDMVFGRALRFAVPVWNRGGERKAMSTKDQVIEDPYQSAISEVQFKEWEAAPKVLNETFLAMVDILQPDEYSEMWKVYTDTTTNLADDAQVSANAEVFGLEEPGTRFFRHLRPEEYEGIELNTRGWPKPIEPAAEDVGVAELAGVVEEVPVAEDAGELTA